MFICCYSLSWLFSQIKLLTSLYNLILYNKIYKVDIIIKVLFCLKYYSDVSFQCKQQQSCTMKLCLCKWIEEECKVKVVLKSP